MNIRVIRLLAISTALIALFCERVSAAEAARGDQAIFDKLVTAIAQADYESFVEEGDDSFRQRTTKEQFDAAVRQLSARLEAGYRATFLGTLKKGGGAVLLWKISLAGIEDEALATLSVKDGRVRAFTIR